MVVSNMVIIFKNYIPKISKKGLFGPKFEVFFVNILHFDKFGGASLKYDNIFFEFQ